MGDQSKWGNNIKFVGNDDKSENSGVHGTELKFDGKDDYLRIDNVEINESEGFTFEFYGKDYGGVIYPLEKSNLTSNGDINTDVHKMLFRTELKPSKFSCCFGPGDSGSTLVEEDTKWWVRFNDNAFSFDDYEYISLVVDYKTNSVKAYSKGKLIRETECNHEYLLGESLLDDTLAFTVGLMLSGSPQFKVFSKFDLYACRLYTRVLDDEEIRKNYQESVNYHNYLTNNKG